jgi:hypothetical protein
MKFADEEDKIRYLKQVIFQKKSAIPRNLKIIKHSKMSGVYYAVDTTTNYAYMVFEDTEAVEDHPIQTIPGYEHLK